MAMTFDRALEELIRICSLMSTAESVEFCVIRDLHGRLRLVLKPDQPSFDIQRLEVKLKADLGAYFVAPILSTAANTEQARLARQLFGQATSWPATWPRVYREPISAQEHSLDERRWRGFQRVLSKESWLNPQDRIAPWALTDDNPALIAFYSFKGGVGRTTLLALLAWHLARQGKKVAILDLDLEAPGVGTLLGAQADRGVLDLILETLITGSPDLTNAYAEASALGTDGAPVNIFPAGNLGWSFLEKLARLDYTASSSTNGSESPVAQALRKVLGKIRSELKPDYILLDSRAGLHDLGGLALNALAHVDVLVSRATEQSYKGLELALQVIGRQAEPSCLIVHSLSIWPESGDLRRLADTERAAFLERVYELFIDFVYRGEDKPNRDDEGTSHYPWRFPQLQSLERISKLSPELASELENPLLAALFRRLEELCRPDPT